MLQRIGLSLKIPADQKAAASRRLPGMFSVENGNWLTIDAAYSDQLAAKAALLKHQKQDVLSVQPEAEEAAAEILTEVLTQLGKRPDFELSLDKVIRPDGVEIPLNQADPLAIVSQLIQEDICVLQKSGDHYVMTAALLCFPASWTLAEKMGRDLLSIHIPVEDYDSNVASRVQRLFEGVQVGRPIWRANLLRYADPALFQPRRENDPRSTGGPNARFLRSEKQTLIRLPKTEAVIFAIHTMVEEENCADV